ncbi:MAG: Peroxiredoxin [Acidobacteriaceae bacterium]|jgi:glutathione peroxidase|nr:Peroxiredoxin [Acidobacteriaceae bacterium]
MISSLYEIQVQRITGAKRKLDAYSGTVLLIVNVTPDCFLTRQCAGLEQLHRTYSDRDFAVLGFPSNDFGNHESGLFDDGGACCVSNYDVRFPMFEAVVAKGASQHPLYRYLTAMQPVAVARPRSNLLKHLLCNGYLSAPPAHGELLWNFEKFLVSRSGEVMARFAPDVTVDQPVILEAIERQLQTPMERRPRSAQRSVSLPPPRVAHVAG